MVWFTHHSGKCGFQTFQKVKCSPRFSRLDFQDYSYNSSFGRRFLRLSPLARTVVSLHNKPDFKRRRCICWVYLWAHRGWSCFCWEGGGQGEIQDHSQVSDLQRRLSPRCNPQTEKLTSEIIESYSSMSQL